tara:strand:- start:247 stop:384 length:138 start_codon:yes stop_codon:yes gene_type:complete
MEYKIGVVLNNSKEICGPLKYHGITSVFIDSRIEEIYDLFLEELN